MTAIRKDEGLTQAEFGERIMRQEEGSQVFIEKQSITGAAISQIEAGARNPSLEAVIRIAEIYNVTTDYLLRGIERINTADGFEDRNDISRLETLARRSGKLPRREQILLEKIFLSFLSKDEGDTGNMVEQDEPGTG